jgi:hypothetical protein
LVRHLYDNLFAFRLLVARLAAFGIEEGRRFARYDRFASGIVGLFGINAIAALSIGSRLD